jgi:hypothetical protein
LLIENPEAYKGKTNADIEKEILKDIGPIPYVARIEKVLSSIFQTAKQVSLIAFYCEDLFFLDIKKHTKHRILPSTS